MPGGGLGRETALDHETPFLWLKHDGTTINVSNKKKMEDPGIDPGTSHMLSERSTI